MQQDGATVKPAVVATMFWLAASITALAGPQGFTIQNAPQALPEVRFLTRDGTRKTLADLHGKVILLNIWATWCPPCVEELPLLSDFYNLNSPKGWQVIGLAVDQVEPVKRFLLKTPVTFPVLMAGATGVELSKSLGNLVGGLPFSVVLGSDGLVAHRKMGKVSPDDLRAWTALK